MPKKPWNKSRADFSLAKASALACGRPDTSIVMYFLLPLRILADDQVEVVVRVERRQVPNVSRTRHVGGFLSTSVASFSVVLNIR